LQAEVVTFRLVNGHGENVGVVEGVELAPELGHVAKHQRVRIENDEPFGRWQQIGGKQLEVEVRVPTRMARMVDS